MELQLILRVWAVCFALANVNSATAQVEPTPDEFVDPDLVACMAATEVLEHRYRARMQILCVDTWVRICADWDLMSGTCWTSNIESMRAFYNDVMPQVLAEMESSSFREMPFLAQRRYRQRVENVREVFDRTSACLGVTGSDLTVCEATTLGLAFIDLFPLARVTGPSSVE